MENIDLEKLTYEELCELEKRIKEEKKKFSSLYGLFVCIDSHTKDYYLCYYTEQDNNYKGFYNVFDDSYMPNCAVANENFKDSSFKTYLKKFNISFDEYKKYRMNDLKELWNKVHKKLFEIYYEKERKIIEERTRRLEEKRRTLKI